MKKKQDEKKMTVKVTVVRMNNETGASKVDCFDLEEKRQVHPDVVLEHVKERGMVPMDAKETHSRALFDADRGGSGYISRFEDNLGCFYRVILDCNGWGEDLSLWGPMDL